MKRHPLIVNRAGGRRPMPRPLADGRAPNDAARPDDADQSWYRIRNAARGGTAEVYIYDEIGYWGVSAQRFVDELREVEADTIELHLNSPGGEVYDGIAIYNALLNHPAQVNVTIDALAASAASFIAQAGHTVTMARNAEMMIHDAIGIAWDNAEGLRELADRLDAVSDNIAGIYADRAGGTSASWRKAMRAESWYSAQEAVDAGLADRVVAVERRGAGDGDTENRWTSRRDAISARFRYVNRGATVTPTATDEPAPDTSIRHTSDGVDDVRPPAEVTAAVISQPWDLAPVLHRDLAIAAGAPAWNVAPDVFRSALELVTNDAPAPDSPPGNPLTRTLDLDGANLNDVLREAVTG